MSAYTKNIKTPKKIWKGKKNCSLLECKSTLAHQPDI